jgi:ABC-type sugar transport system substrate-binding protein
MARVLLSVCAICLLLSLALAACDRSPSSNTIGVSIQGDRWGDRSNDFYPKLQAAMEATTKQHYKFRLSIVRAGTDPAMQQQQIEDFISNHVRAIVVVPVDSQEIDPAILEANTAGIPVFTVDIRSVPGEGDVAESITSDNYSGGFAAGQAICNAIPEGTRIAVLDQPDITSAQDRVTGFTAAIKRCPQVSPSSPPFIDADAGSRTATAQRTMTAILEKYPNVRGVFAINDTLALGAVSALPHDKRVKVVGYDDIPVAKEDVDKGPILAEIAQDPECLGTVVIQEVYRVLASGGSASQHNLATTVEVPVAIYKRGMSSPKPVSEVAGEAQQGIVRRRIVRHPCSPPKDAANRAR